MHARRHRNPARFALVLLFGLFGSAAIVACSMDVSQVRPRRSPNQVSAAEMEARDSALKREAAEQMAAWQREMDAAARSRGEAARSREATARARENLVAARSAPAPAPVPAPAPAINDDESNPPQPAAEAPRQARANPAAPMAAPAIPAAPPPVVAPSHRDDQRLGALIAERSRVSPEKSYRIGGGDLLEINVFDLPEMNRKVRVSSGGTIQLPLIGSVRVLGQNEADVAKEIASRLEKDYLQNPQVDVFVEEYKSQQVAVTGSVAKPGLYPLTRERYTVIDMLSEAGGLTKEAGPVVEFIPASGAGRSSAFDVASTGARLSPQNDSGNGITIDLNELLRGGNRNAMNVPVVAGDVIFVPESGSFTIEGWVDKPGTYPISRNMTVLAALSTGGGPLFPSRLGRVEVLRNNETGAGRSAQVVDLNAVRAGELPDVELRSGDIVRVPGYKTLMIPWGIFTFVKSLISIGASIPII